MSLEDRYAAFVWPAYAVTALVFVGLTVWTILRAQVWRRRAERLEAEERRR